MNSRIKEIAIELEAQRALAEVGLEGFSSFTEFLTKFTDFFRKNEGAVIEHKFGFISRSNAASVMGLVGKTPYEALSKIEVYQPVGFKDNIYPYIVFLNDLLNKLSNIEKRLYIPLSKYFQKAVSLKNFSDALWIDSSLSFIDYKNSVDTLGTFFDPTINRNNQTHLVPFGDVYFAGKELPLAYQKLLDAEKIVAKIDLRTLKRAEERLYEDVNLFISAAKEDPEIISANKQTITKVVNTVNAIVGETELLSLTIYNYNTVYTAISETILKLKDNLS